MRSVLAMSLAFLALAGPALAHAVNDAVRNAFMLGL